MEIYVTHGWYLCVGGIIQTIFQPTMCPKSKEYSEKMYASIVKHWWQPGQNIRLNLQWLT